MTKEEILEGIKGLTALELSELVHDLEEAFGVSAAAPVAVAAVGGAAAGGDAGAAEEKSDFDVVLESFGDNKIAVIKVDVYKRQPYDSRGAASNTTFLGLDAGNLVGPTIGGMIVSLFIASGLSEAQSYNGMFFVLIVPVLIAFIVFLMARKSVMRPAK